MTTYERRRPEETGTETADMSSGAASGYVNPYAGQIQDIYQSITEREPFQYDVNADVMYQNLRDQYITGGQMAMMDTMGQAAQLTGGYGNSYAQGVGQQAYQGYLRGLNDQIPDLYDMALQNYIREGDAMLQQYGMLQDMAADDYGKWIDDRNFGYQQEQDQAAADRWQQEFDYAQEQDQADRDYRNQQFEYQQEQDQADRDYQAQQDARNMAMAMLEAGTMPSEEMLAAAGLTNEFVGALYPQLMPGAAGASGGAGDLTIDRTTKWYTGDDYLDWVGSAQGSAWQSTSQGHAWLYDTVLPTVRSYFDAGEISAAREVLMAMGLTQASIAEVERMYDESKQMS